MKKTLPLIFSAFFSVAQADRLVEPKTRPLPAKAQGVAAQRPSGLAAAVNLPAAEIDDALEFLYRYLPAPDAADYPRDYFAEQAAFALRARREMPWGKNVPEREWRHFVLPPRVNNEALDRFRPLLYEELKARVAGLGMEQAVIEINRWCHEHVTYKPSDARTSSPLATIRTATGRCGEESTLTVAALRTVGIPARQVYTPRWAHTDDNHAWVEAFVDGRWCFLGACEPEPVLNLGWFNAPASRGMLMHTKVFGHYDGSEDVISRTPCYTEINVTSNYAATCKSTVRVVDESGRPVPSATVAFKLYNYAELYTVYKTKTDSDGRASILTGLGDFVAWATDGRRYGFTKVTAGAGQAPEVKLNHRPGDTFEAELTLTPPREKNNMPHVTPEQRADNTRRLAVEDSIRAAYVAGFPDSVAARGLADRLKLPYERLRPLVEKSCGNSEALVALLEKYPAEATLCWLETLTDKDLRDFSAPVLMSHLSRLGYIFDKENNLDADSYKFVLRYVASPRIANEAITPWRDYLQQELAGDAAKYAADPAALARLIARRTTDTGARNPQGLLQSPVSAWKTAKADRASRRLLFVAACRTIGVAARIDEVTGKTQYAARSEGTTEATADWKDADGLLDDTNRAATPTQAAASAALALEYAPRQYMENPHYYTHFTLAEMGDGGLPQLLNYPESATWKTDFETPRKLAAGHYLLTTGTRLADGTVLARLSAFTLPAGATAEVPLVMRNDETAVAVIGGLNSETLYRNVESGKDNSILATTGRGYYALALLRGNHEPSNHILHDLARQREALEAWGRPLLLLFESTAAYEAFAARRNEFGALPANVHFGVDTGAAVASQLIGTPLAPQADGYPVVVIADTFNRVVFASQGYTIGIGDRLKTVIPKL